MKERLLGDQWPFLFVLRNGSVAPEALKFRTDLIINRQDGPEGSAFVVKDPRSGRFFRLREPELFIAQQLDGETPAEVIRNRVEEKFGAALSTEVLAQFIERLRRIGLLEVSGEEGGHFVKPQARIRGSPLYLRFKAFDPDRLFDRLLSKVHLFFTPHFLVFSVVIILFAFVITISSWSEIARDFVGLFELRTLLFAWLTILLVTTAHEFAHGLTCKHFGGEVHELGFMLLYFQPAFYCNVSDAWLFREKSKRLWVTFAGAYFELFVWGLATVTWRVTDSDTALNYAALVVMATSGIKTLFNLNPLIKLDGYYLLSDYLEIPNLRQKAFSYLRDRIKRSRGSVTQAVDVTPRERRVYVTYGLLAGVFSFSLLGFIGLKLGGYLIESYQALGFFLFLGFLMILFRNSLKKVRLGLSPVFNLDEKMPSFGRRIPALIGLAAALAILVFGRMELKVSAEFVVLPVQNADIRAEVDGIIEAVFVNEGDWVKRGDPIVRLSERDYVAELRKIDSELNEKQAKLVMLRAGPRSEEVKLARSEVETAKTRLAHARVAYAEARQKHAERAARAKISIEKADELLRFAVSHFKRSKELFQRQLVSLKEFEEAEKEAAVRARELEEAEADLSVILADDLAESKRYVAVSEKELTEAEGRLRVLLAGSRPEEIKAAEAEIERLKAVKHHLQEQLQLTRILSPVSGRVTTPKMWEKAGQLANKGDLIAKVYDLNSIIAEVPLPEKEIADVQVGQRVLLKARAYPEERFDGQVISIAPAARKEEESPARRTIRVTVQIEHSDRLLKPEMTGNAKIYCGQRRIIELMTRRVLRYVKVEFWSWW